MQPHPGGLELPDLADLIQRPEWFSQAGCRGADLAPYFPSRGASAEHARAVCHTCMVRRECLDYALADPDLVGVWGGTSARERAAMRRAVA